MDEPVRIGISACLLGEKVRWDGNHKRDGYLVGTVGRFVEWVPVCPEQEIGMGIPREPIRLERRGDGVHLVAPGTGRDWTGAMRAFAARRVRQLEGEGLSGFILKKDSPSCGMERVRVHGRPSTTRDGRGLFAAALIEGFPLLPVEEEGRLSDPGLRENFFERVFAYRRLRSFFGARWTVGDLVAFHAAQKLLVMSHSNEAYRRLGRLVAGAKGLARKELKERYEREYMEGLLAPATPKRHANVLEHMLGYVSKRLSPDERQEMVTVIADHRRGLVPLLVPLTLLRHHIRRFQVTYLLGQAYLDPHPKELMLRSHV